MQITWYGQSFFRILTQKGKNNQVNLVIDPFNETIGLRPPKLEADILLITHQHSDHNNLLAVSGNPFVISGPGEYEIKGVFIQGIPSFHDNVRGKERGLNTIYTIETEEIRLCHLGDLGQKELDSEQLEKIGDIDILMIPIGGVYTISAKEASKVISQSEPKIVIPMHYQIPKLKIKLEGLNKFLKMMGIKTPEILKKFLIKKKDLAAEGMKIIILKP
ncbi:MBL fold metallo-hydrolase [Patescibacteria group bacterium]|nr:MBL fold metallo-hydrolase [Patescibacteria group bacterium]